MRILFNCAVNREGGAIQNAANFILRASLDMENTFVFLVSSPVYDVLECWGCLDERVILIGHPLHDARARFAVAKIEREFAPDVVYTMAGPSYFKFKAFHVLGISDGYITHANLSIFFYGRPLLEGVKHITKTFLKGILSRFEANAYIFQTRTAMNGYCSRFFLSSRKSRLVPNSLGQAFKEQPHEFFDFKDVKRQTFYVLCPSADYSHKDILIIDRMADLLRRSPADARGYKIIFYVTVKPDGFFCKFIEKINKKSEFLEVINKGPYLYSNAGEIYKDCDVVFMPSLLETFSTSYLEALAARKWLLAADMAFAREVCGNAAIYFEPKSGHSAINKLINIFSENYRIPDVSIYNSILAKYGDYERRYSKLIHAITDLYSTR